MAGLLSKLRSLEAVEKKQPASVIENTSVECYHRADRFPLSLFADADHATLQTLKNLYGFQLPREISREDILFLDTETTGLSGGAGTLAFEVGIGYFTSNAFIVEQFVMRDYSEEVSLLRALGGPLSRFTVLCSFNGRSFDVPLLESRYRMNRIQVSFPPYHADCLYPSRRIWKLRLKTCTLGNLESRLLGIHREDDLPGALVPEVFFRYLKDRNFTPVEKVMDHNRQDIVSLAQLFYHLALVTDQPQTLSEEMDLFSMARMLEKSNSHEKARTCYQMSATGTMKGPALAALALQEKREGNIDLSLRLYRSMLKTGHRSVKACEEIAKIYEHKLKDPERALAVTRQALWLLSEPSLEQEKDPESVRQSLKKRYSRLSRKCAEQNKEGTEK